jgi:hypothetical protein
MSDIERELGVDRGRLVSVCAPSCLQPLWCCLRLTMLAQ